MFGINKTLLNILLLGCVAFLVAALYTRWTRELPGLPGGTAVVASQQSSVGAVVQKKKVPQPTLSRYQAVVKRDLFSPERKEFVAKSALKKEEVEPAQDEKVVQTVKVSGRELVFYGVVTTGKEVRALIRNPVSSANRKSQWVKQGTKIGDLTVARIEPDRIVFKGKGDTLELRLRDTSRKKSAQRGGNAIPVQTKKAAPNLVTTKKKKRAAPKTSEMSQMSGMSGMSGNSGSKKKEETIIHTPFGIIRR
ncbi:MAG: hypothetical protein CSA20_00270 [Deltaproteobacteria bacterium]|nr:MAG: hypothetical protein CSA20_00270 [Deltaproteobacteria bacterium]